MYTCKQGLILLLTFVLCMLGCIAVIRPLVDFKNKIEKSKTKNNFGYYNFICTDFNSSNLESIEKDLSTSKEEYIAVCQKEFDVEYLNFHGRGNVVSLSETCLKDLQNTYGKKEFGFFKLGSGRIPEKSTEVLVLGFAYSEWNYDLSGEKKIEKAAVLPELGECITTGSVTTKDSLSFPVELKSGFIVTNSTFDLISKNANIDIFVLVERALDSAEEATLRNVISKYATVVEANYIENRIDTSGDEATFTLAVELSLLLIVALIFGEIIVLSDFIKEQIDFLSVCTQLGISGLKCFILNELFIASYLIISNVVFFLILLVAMKCSALSFLNIDWKYRFLVVLFNSMVILFAGLALHFKSEKKG